MLKVVLGLTSPLDIADSIRVANRVAGSRKSAEELKALVGDIRVPLTFEEALLERGMTMRGPEMAIMQAMDEGFDRESDRRNGRSRSALDFLASSQATSAVAALYAKNSRMKLDLAAEDPFSPSAAVGGAGPDFAALIRRTLAENDGFSTEEKSLAQAALDTAFGDHAMATGSGSKNASSASTALLDLSHTISPRLASALGYNRGGTSWAGAV